MVTTVAMAQPVQEESPATESIDEQEEEVAGTLIFSAGGSLLDPTVHLAVEGGLRFGNLGVLAKAEWNPWFSVQDPGKLKRGVLNVGLGADIVYFEDRVRSGFFAGASTLLFDTPLDEMGETGFFIELNLATLRWEIKDDVWMSVTPATLHVAIPVTGGIPLVVLAYRHSVNLEFVF